jgi:alginate O-acetyltransferase complex protein AlgJ
MAEEIPDKTVGGEEPRRPTHSLPRYSEPTPETHRKLSRETEAELALKHTIFTPGARFLLIALFLLTITAVPAIQIAAELRAPRPSGGLATFDIYKVLPTWRKIRAVRNVARLWRLLPRAADLKAAEKSIESDSVVSKWLLPRVQAVLTGQLRAGNEQVYLGNDEWLFYRLDVDYITGPPFLDASQMKRRLGVQPDPTRAIVDFRNQLAARGIELILVPVPVKPGIEANHLSARADGRTPLHNASFPEFKTRLEMAGVRVFNPIPSLMRSKPGASYLRSDTHWRPEMMELAAESLAALLPPSPTTHIPFQVVPKEIVGPLGDIAKMLSLPPSQNLYGPENITIHQVLSGNTLWHPSKDGDILLLGDSFSNIFSLESGGWGESAGFAEHLSRASGRPLDCILRNGGGASVTREILSRDLARGRDRLAGKKVVVWEFVERELAFGDWKIIEMKLGQPVPARFFVPKAGEEVVVNGTVEAISTVPRAGTVPYKDHILALHLTDLAVEGGSKNEPLEALVYLESMRDNVLTAAARFRPGDRVTLRLRAWTEVSDQYEKINRSEIDDPAVQLEEPCWGEIVR